MVSVLRAPSLEAPAARRFPIGVEVLREPDGSTRAHARVWAPDCQSVELVTESGPEETPLIPEGAGYHSGFVNVSPGTRYWFRLDGGDLRPDPASRFQPRGPHGPSMVVDPTSYTWGDHSWPGVSMQGQVLYEIHVGTFTKAGTFRSAIERLPELVDTGITTIEIMPVADFTGHFGWGYDGVNFFAPSRLYGTPDDFRAFVDAAHGMDLGVILDVVYNHFGPDGNYLPRFSSRYLAAKASEWGDSPNFDGPDCGPVREYFLTNARYWIEEFHLDGLRLDATQQIFDESTPHIIAELTDTVRSASGKRRTVVIAENETQDTRLVRPREVGGFALDAMWNDDFHHAIRVAVTGRSEAYYSGYRGVPQEFISAAKYGFLYQGQWFRWQHKRRGTPALDVPPTRFVAYTQNHDQVANTAAGQRLHQETSPGRFRAATALLLLLPETPLLFQGQDFCASSPFHYFADHTGELADAVRTGRAGFISQFPSIAAKNGARTPDPADPLTFLRSKIDWSERRAHAKELALHRDLLALRREDSVIRAPRERGLDGAVLGDEAFVIRFFGGRHGDRLLVVNLGRRLHLDPIGEPLLAPPLGGRWRTIFSTESPAYGGWGTPDLETASDAWWIPAESAVLLGPTS